MCNHIAVLSFGETSNSCFFYKELWALLMKSALVRPRHYYYDDDLLCPDRSIWGRCLISQIHCCNQPHYSRHCPGVVWYFRRWPVVLKGHGVLCRWGWTYNYILQPFDWFSKLENNGSHNAIAEAGLVPETCLFAWGFSSQMRVWGAVQRHFLKREAEVAPRIGIWLLSC